MWDKERYEEVSRRCETDLRTEKKSAYALMGEYKQAIVLDDFETAKAITDVLAKRGHRTIETHSEITCLN